MKHIGVRPEYPLEADERSGHKKLNIVYYENFPDGSYKIWNKKLLNSGCGQSTDQPIIKDANNLLWCKHCQEWCNENQFIKE